VASAETPSLGAYPRALPSHICIAVRASRPAMSHRGGGQRQGGGAEAGPSTVLGPADQDGADGFTLVPQKDDLPAVSDTTFKEFYESLDEFLPTASSSYTSSFCAALCLTAHTERALSSWSQIPDGLTEHALQRCGFEQPDHRMCVGVGATKGAATLTYVCWLPLLHSVRLVSLAAEKFVEDVGKDVKECAVVCVGGTPVAPVALSYTWWCSPCTVSD